VSVESAPFETNLSDSREGFLASPLELNACLNSHGLYDPLRFVLRLSPEVHRKIEALQAEFAARRVSFEGLRAFSTYVHETIHWWQHAGSTIGLMLSLSYPAQAHSNHGYLKKLLERVGPKKSIRQFVESQHGPGGDPDTPAGLGSVIVNNHFDIEFFRRLVFKPEFAHDTGDHPYFDCVGHSFQIAYGNIGLVLATTLDPELSVMPDARNWSVAFAAMRSEKRKGYYWGSPVNILPIGAHQNCEGQARFGQLQYLYFASGGKLSWDDVRSFAHGVDEDPLRRLPVQGQLQHVRLDRQLEPVAVVRLAHRLEAVRHFLCVAVLATGADLRAAGYRVPRRVGPFECCGHICTHLEPLSERQARGGS
jgi:hypothetical protein